MSSYKKRIEESHNWLSKNVFPLWIEKGIDRKNNGFFEAIDFSGQTMNTPRRTMVQSRQIYSFLTAAKMNCIQQEIADFAIIEGARQMILNFSNSDSSFLFSINSDETPHDLTPTLYTQAFALFGLAQAYSITSSEEFKKPAKKLLSYLYKSRKASSGGFTEVDSNSVISYASNPHMHLFEAAIAWMQVDEDPDWKILADEVANLAVTKFICPQTKVLGELFDSEWNHLRNSNNLFMYEPGHQYEWAWLFSHYQELTGVKTQEISHQLFLLAEKHGTSKTRHIVYDEMWSDFTPKTLSSRFWPQCERIKAAVRLGTEVDVSQKEVYAKAADEAITTLSKFFQTPVNGLWYDQLSAEDKFSGSSAKASSLYHIINAMEEYSNLRGLL